MGVINLTSAINIANPNITIAGQTAPSPGIALHGAGLNFPANARAPVSRLTDAVISKLMVTWLALTFRDLRFAAVSKTLLSLSLLAGVNASAPALTAAGWAGQNGGTTGGTGGVTVTVSNATDFRTYAEDSTTRIIQVSGALNLGTSAVAVRSNKTIVGLGTTAQLIGSLYIKNPYRNVIVKNLTISNDAGAADGDGITVFGGINVWIDHCTFLNCADGLVDITAGADFATVSWCKFYYTRDNGHNLANLVGGTDTSGATDTGKLNVTWHRNWYGTMVTSRAPRVRFVKNHVYNNYFNSPGNNYYIGAAISSEILVQNNSFEGGQRAWYYYNNTPRGKINASGNQFVNIAVPTDGTDSVFTPPYAYTLAAAATIKAAVTAGAGVNGDSGSGDTIFDTFESGNANGWTSDGGTWGVAQGVTKVYRRSNNGAVLIECLGACPGVFYSNGVPVASSFVPIGIREVRAFYGRE